ncbi:E3 ubiquitin-protein ligase TRIM71-like [Sycon ciliatum]|uniref:E3 ubiquitin-protein ligase TRIM71-like n=1 Tax=Sycon ciliatum TaxID=27933 RepID=UPI0031F65478
MNRPDCVSCRSSSTRGKLLKCFHSVCVQCLETHTSDDSSVKCPDCGATTPPPSAGVPLLQFLPNSDIGDGAASASVGASKKLCDECGEDTEAVAVCMDCSDCLCAVHAEAHPVSRRTYKHKVVPLTAATSVTTTSTTNSMEFAAAKCPLHPSCTQSHYCMACQKILCNSCLASSRHDQHVQDLLPIDEAVSTIRESLLTKIRASFSGGDSQLEQALAATNNALSQLHNQTETVSSQINDICMELKNAVDKRQQQLLDELDKVQSEHRSPLEVRKCRVLSGLSAGQSVKHLAGCCQSGSNFLKMCAWLEEATEDIMATVDVEAESFPSVNLLFTTLGRENVLMAIAEAGCVSTIDAMSHENSSATIPAEVSEGQDLCVYIDLRNDHGVELRAAEEYLDTVRVDVTSPDNTMTACPVVKATDATSSPSRLVAMFKTAGLKGQVRVSATANTTHLQGSPAVTAIVDPVLFDPWRCHANLALSNNGRTVTHDGPVGKRSAVCGLRRWRRGKYEMSIRLDKCAPHSADAYEIFLGVLNIPDPILTGYYSTFAWNNSNSNGGLLGQPWQAGDVIHMSLDCERHTLVGRHERTGATDTKKNVAGELYLYVSLKHHRNQVTIL